MRRSGALVIALGAALLLATRCLAQTSPSTAPTTNPTARGVIELVMHDALATLRDPSLSKTDKSVRIRKIADKHIDFETLARLSLGRYWRDLSEAQRAEYVKEFEKHVSATHGKVLDEYTDEDVVVTGERQEQRGDCTVQTSIVSNRNQAGKKVANVDYRLRQNESRWRIIDVTIDGVSMAANFRAQFQDIMAKGGIDQLLKLLREKNVSGKQ